MSKKHDSNPYREREPKSYFDALAETFAYHQGHDGPPGSNWLPAADRRPSKPYRKLVYQDPKYWWQQKRDDEIAKMEAERERDRDR